MPVSEVSSTLANFGFPAVMCGILFWYMDRQGKLHRDEMNTLREEFTENRKAITQLEKAITKLIYHLERERKEEKE